MSVRTGYAKDVTLFDRAKAGRKRHLVTLTDTFTIRRKYRKFEDEESQLEQDLRTFKAMVENRA